MDVCGRRENETYFILLYRILNTGLRKQKTRRRHTPISGPANSRILSPSALAGRCCSREPAAPAAALTVSRHAGSAGAQQLSSQHTRTLLHSRGQSATASRWPKGEGCESGRRVAAIAGCARAAAQADRAHGWFRKTGETGDLRRHSRRKGRNLACGQTVVVTPPSYSR